MPWLTLICNGYKTKQVHSLIDDLTFESQQAPPKITIKFGKHSLHDLNPYLALQLIAVKIEKLFLVLLQEWLTSSTVVELTTSFVSINFFLKLFKDTHTTYFRFKYKHAHIKHNNQQIKTPHFLPFSLSPFLSLSSLSISLTFSLNFSSPKKVFQMCYSAMSTKKPEKLQLKNSSLPSTTFRSPAL